MISSAHLISGLSVGKQANINLSSAGDLFSACNNFSNLKPEPAEMRVLSLSEFSVIGRPAGKVISGCA